MIDIIGEFLVHAFMEGGAKIPGSFIGWMLKGFKTSFDEEMKDENNTVIAVIFWIIILGLIIFWLF